DLLDVTPGGRVIDDGGGSINFDAVVLAEVAADDAALERPGQDTAGRHCAFEIAPEQSDGLLQRRRLVEHGGGARANTDGDEEDAADGGQNNGGDRQSQEHCEEGNSGTRRSPKS